MKVETYKSTWKTAMYDLKKKKNPPSFSHKEIRGDLSRPAVVSIPIYVAARGNLEYRHVHKT